MSLRELDQPSLEDALAYLDLLAEQKPEKLERAAVRWHGRLETEATFLSLAESQLALAALASLCAGDREAVGVRSGLSVRARCWPRKSNSVRLGSYVSRAAARREIAGIRPEFWPRGQLPESYSSELSEAAI